jgi:nucleoside-diphosphate-sugar epimerase
MAVVNCKLWHLFGPKDSSSKFVVSIIQSLLRNDKFIDLTDGLQKRDFIYVDDVVHAYMYIIDAFAENKIIGFYEYEVGTGTAVSVREIVEAIKDLSGNESTELRFGALPKREGEYADAKANPEALEVLGWKPATSLKDGLAKTIEFEKNKVSS